MGSLDEEQGTVTSTLFGRIQTRLFLVVTVGVVWTLLIGPMLTVFVDDASVGDIYRLAFGALVLVAVVGIAWELVYHGLQQFRWEKDWPTLFGLLTAVNEGIVVALLLSAGIPWDVGGVPWLAFTIHFATTWIVIWLVANGPMRIVSLRWRFRGGRLV